MGEVDFCIAMVGFGEAPGVAAAVRGQNRSVVQMLECSRVLDQLSQQLA